MMTKKIKIERSGLPKGMRKGAYVFCAVMCIPALYGIFRYVIVNVYSVLLAFTNGEPFSDPFSLDNFRMLFIQLKAGGEISLAVRNTLKYFAIGIVKLFLCYFIAYFLYRKIPGHKVFRFLFFLPCLISPVVSASIYKNLLVPGGPVWTILKNAFGIEYLSLFTRPETATKTILLYSMLTGFGTTYLIFLGAMNRIPTEITESAQLDGCSSLREFFFIVIPLTWATFSTFLLMNIAMVFTSSGPILYFTNGAADTSTLGFWIFNQVRGDSYNYPAAIGVFFTLIGLPILFGTRWLINRVDAGVTY